ncbi:hypothetical protein QBC38DRAFT_474412 [Podospora fimiseda]|uniref:Uncharacterized protein n=1 Tax=Podospora fimiseda TaxID=252190 RepID=A0AAN7H5Q8_9PEZI|nr:hypothetical protein QBC38DRAFT_474412 [Podospora fimiseda]
MFESLLTFFTRRIFPWGSYPDLVNYFEYKKTCLDRNIKAITTAAPWAATESGYGDPEHHHHHGHVKPFCLKIMTYVRDDLEPGSSITTTINSSESEMGVLQDLHDMKGLVAAMGWRHNHFERRRWAFPFYPCAAAFWLWKFRRHPRLKFLGVKPIAVASWVLVTGRIWTAERYHFPLQLAKWHIALVHDDLRMLEKKTREGVLTESDRSLLPSPKFDTSRWPAPECFGLEQ